MNTKLIILITAIVCTEPLLYAHLENQDASHITTENDSHLQIEEGVASKNEEDCIDPENSSTINEQVIVEELEEELGVELEDISLNDINELEKKTTISQRGRMFLEILKLQLNKAREIADKQINEHKLIYSLGLIGSTALATTLLIWLLQPQCIVGKVHAA